MRERNGVGGDGQISELEQSVETINLFALLIPVPIHMSPKHRMIEIWAHRWANSFSAEVEIKGMAALFSLCGDFDSPLRLHAMSDAM